MMKSKNLIFVRIISLTAYLMLPAIAYAQPMPAGNTQEQAEMISLSDQSNKEEQSYSASSRSSAVAYRVNRGDTLYKIATAFGSSVQELTAANGITNPNLLKIGQKLRIPYKAGAVQLPIPAEGELPVIKKVLTSTLTAYTPGFESTGKTADDPEYGITYSGIKAKEGRTIAVDPSIIPLGSKVYIEGVGIRTAEDTGSAIRGSRIDVYMNDLGQAQNFGVKRNVKVFVL